MILPLDWFTIEVNCDPYCHTSNWPDGYWQRYSKKYASLRRAKQALPYLQARTPTWCFRIVTCHLPLCNSTRIAHNLPSWDNGEVVETHLPPKTL